MKMKTIRKTFALVIVILAVINCQDQKIVARVGNQLINLKEFKESFLADKNERQAAKLPFSRRLEHLNQMIDDRLELIDAYQEGLDKDETILTSLKENEKKLVYRYVIEKNIISKVIPEKLLKKEYEKSGVEVKCRHIFIPKKKDMTKEEKARITAQLESLRKRVLRGESFDKLAREFSRDSLSAGKGGDLGFIKWGKRGFGNAFYSKVFSMLVGEVSHPIESTKGFHIVLVENRRKVAQPSFEKNKNRLLQLFFRKRRQSLEEEYQKFVKKIRDYYRAHYVDENIEFFLKKINASEDGEKKTEKYNVNNFSREDRQKALFVFDGGNYTIGQLIERLEKLPVFKRPSLQSKENVKEYLDNVVNYYLIAHYGLDKKYQRKKEIAEKLEKRKHELMIKEIQKRRIYDQVNPSEEDIKKYFEEHQSRYYEPEKVKVQEILVTTFQLAQKISRQAKNNVDFDKLVAKYNSRSLTKNKKGILGYITEYQYGEIGRRAIKMKVGEISEPIKVGRSYSVIKILDRQNKRQKTFEEAKAKVRRDLRVDLQKRKREEWLKKLRHQYTVQIYQGNLRQAFPSSDEF